MSKKKRIANRKCSALLAAGTGAAVCLTGGGVHATNGLVSVSNGGNSTFAGTSTFSLFGGKITCSLHVSTSVTFFGFNGNLGSGQHNKGYGELASVTINDTNLSWSTNALNVPIGVFPTAQYVAIRFQDSGTKFGWAHVASNSGFPGGFRLDQWSYNNAGGSIATLSDSVTTGRLALADGKEKLHWVNENEDGVARYEVQSQDAAGNWTAADSDVPGSGSYSAKVAAGKTCRLVVEMTDGSTKEIDF